MLWPSITTGLIMYGQYLWAVVNRALQPTTRIAEVVQVLVAIAAPGIAHMTGVPMPPADNIFTYVGYALAAFVALRILFVAPFELWREQTGQISKLKLELAEPERIEIAHMASIRAEKRLELAALLRRVQWDAFHDLGDESEHFLQVITLMGQAGTPKPFNNLLQRFNESCKVMRAAQKAGLERPQPETEYTFGIVADLIQFLHGRATSAELEGKLAEFPEQPQLPLEQPEQPPANP